MKAAPKNSQAGFTLIELLIVSLMLIFIGISTFQAMRATISAKEDVDLKTEVLQEGRAVLAIMTRDIGLAYYFVAEDFIWEQPTRPTNLPAGEAWTPPQPTGAKPKPVTIFQGKENEIFLSSKSHQRTFADSPENEMHFVTYQLDGGHLVRGESVRAVNLRDRDDKATFNTFVLIENIKTFKLGYYDPQGEKWVTDWDTEKPEYKDRLPAAVRIEIEYLPDYDQDRTRRKIEPIKIISAVRITENGLRTMPKTGPGAAAGANPGVGGTVGPGGSTGGGGL